MHCGTTVESLTTSTTVILCAFALRHRVANLFLGVVLLDAFTFVVFTPALGEGELNLDEPAREMDIERNECLPILAGRLGELADLATGHQQFARPAAFVIEDARLRILGDVGIDQPDFVILEAGISFINDDMVVANAFDFAPLQNDAALEFAENVIIMPRTTVSAHDL